MSTDNVSQLCKLGKFIYKAMTLRNELLNNAV